MQRRVPVVVAVVHVQPAVKRRGVFAVLGGRVSVASEEFLNTLGAAAGSSPVKRCVAVFVGKVGFGLGEEKEIDYV